MDDRELIKFFNLESVVAHVWVVSRLSLAAVGLIV